MIRYVEISVGKDGASGCRRCSPAHPSPRYRPAKEILDDVKAVVDAWHGAPGPNVSFGGAEPFSHPELPRLVSDSIAAGVSRLGITTDGLALCNTENAAGCIDAGVRHADIALLGGSPATHDALSGNPGSFDAARHGARCLLDAATASGEKVVVCGRTRVCRHNADDMAGIVLAFVETGVSTISLEIDPKVTLSHKRALLEAAIETGIVYGVWVSVVGPSPEELGEYSVHAWAPVSIVATPPWEEM